MFKFSKIGGVKNIEIESDYIISLFYKVFTSNKYVFDNYGALNKLDILNLFNTPISNGLIDYTVNILFSTKQFSKFS